MSARHWGTSIGAAMLAIGIIATAAAQEDLDETPAGQCWQSYTLCIEAAFQEEAWRSACYADLTACLNEARPARCHPSAQAYCADFLNRCREVGSGTPDIQSQCRADHDACLMSFGC